MWKVAAMAVSEVPIYGVGWSRVSGTYGEVQERYFAENKESAIEKHVAGAPEFVFNEYLQTAIAFGLFSALSLVTLTLGGLIVAIHNRRYDFAGSTTSAAIVMFSSYPLQFSLFATLIAIVFICAWLCSSCKIVGWTATVVTISSLMLFFINNEKVDVRSNYTVAHALHKRRIYGNSNQMLLGMLPYTSDPMVLNIIGKNYQGLGMADSAEYYFNKSVNRCPNRLYP